jgi:hypothetical protein
MDADIQGEGWLSGFLRGNWKFAVSMFNPITPLIGVHRRPSAVPKALPAYRPGS